MEAGSGPVASLRALGATLLELVGSRIELAVVELREESARRKGMLALAVVGALFVALGLLLVAGFIVLLFWDTHRLAALGAVTLVYLGIAAYCFMRLRREQLAARPPFEATLRELAADLRMLGGRHE